MKRYVIIGNSTAAAGCIEGIRQSDRDGTVTVISNKSYHIYSRPLISYLMNGKTDLERMKYRPDDFYQKNRVTTILGQEAVKIDPQNKFVLWKTDRAYPTRTFSGNRLQAVYPADGRHREGEQPFTFMTLDDAKASAEITPESRVLIIGAGLIGLKCAEGILGRVKKITVVDLADRILPSILDEKGSKMVKTHLEKNGLTILSFRQRVKI